MKDTIQVVIASYFLDPDGLVLPGVGSFSSAQRILLENKKQIVGAIDSKSLPILGICLGMQLLFETSEEGKGRGLGLFKGSVRRFSKDDKTKVPHMGWNTLTLSNDNKNGTSSKICSGIINKSWVYYVHSYYPMSEDESLVKAWTKHGATKFPAIIEKGSIFGTQFHPEKSASVGFKLISNFKAHVIKR